MEEEKSCSFCSKKIGERMKLKLVTAKETKEFLAKGDEIVVKVWPEFMLNDQVANEYFFRLYDDFPEYQFWLLHDNDIVGIGNSIPIRWDKTLEELPDEGWDWALKKGFIDKQNKDETNYLCGLSITINPKFQGHGFSKKMVQSMIDLARKYNKKGLILPVRPSEKKKHQEVSMEDYIQQKRSDRLPKDAWLRVHARLNGRMIKVCAEAMKIRGTIQQWENWTKCKFNASGNYPIPGALTSVNINIEENYGEYIEPNVWMVHEIL